MVYTVALFDSKNPDVTPVWWKNFTRNNPPGHRFDREETNTRLLEYAASYSVMSRNGRGTNRHLDFYDEPAYTWFMLRWS